MMAEESLWPPRTKVQRKDKVKYISIQLADNELVTVVPNNYRDNNRTTIPPQLTLEQLDRLTHDQVINLGKRPPYPNYQHSQLTSLHESTVRAAQLDAAEILRMQAAAAQRLQEIQRFVTANPRVALPPNLTAPIQ